MIRRREKIRPDRQARDREEHRIGAFDRISPVYDLLAMTVFGRAIQRSQLRLLEGLPTAPRVLLLGGGSGWLLEALMTCRPDAEVLSVDASPAMNRRAAARIRRREARTGRRLSVTLISATHSALDIPPLSDQPPFDVLITPFFLDVFSPAELPRVMGTLSGRLTREGRWLFADFCPPLAGWRAALVWLMYRFFRLSTGLTNQHLSDFRRHFTALGFRPENAARLAAGMILSAIWRRATREGEADEEPGEATRDQ